MSRESAFKLRTANPETSGRFEAEKRMDILGTKEGDRKKVESLRYFLSLIKDPKKSFQELSLRIQRSLDSTTGRLIGSIGGSKQPFREAGREVVLNPNEIAFEVDPQIQKTLIDFAKEKTQARNEVVQTINNLKSLSIYISLISRRDITFQEISLRIQRSFDQSGRLQKRSKNGNIELFTKDETPVQLDMDERMLQVDTDTQKLLLDVAKDKVETRNEKTKTDTSIESLNHYLTLINNPQISLQELSLRIQRSINEQGVLQGRVGSEIRQFRKNGAVVVLTPAERLYFVDEATQKLLLELAAFVRDENIPNELRENLQNYLPNRDQRSLNRIREVSASLGGSQAGQKAVELAEKLERTNKTLKFTQEFYTRVAKNEDIKSLNGFLDEYEQKDLADKELIERLRRQAFAERRFRLISGSLADGLTTDEKLTILQDLAKSVSNKDKQAAVLLARNLYQAELAQIKYNILNLVDYDLDPNQIRLTIDQAPVRPAIGSIDYVTEINNLREKISPVIQLILKTKRIEKALELRSRFDVLSPQEVLIQIKNLPEETVEDIAVKMQLIDLYRTFTAANNKEIFDEQFAGELNNKLQAELREKFINPELGKNKKALAYLRERFVSTIYPLIEAFKDDPRTRDTVNEILERRREFLQKIADLQQQRPLTDTERDYLESVELLSVYNPYMIAAANADYGVTNEFLRHHFEQLSRETLVELKDGDYVPLISIGLGPNGLAALGEIVRNNPELARQLLVIDAGDQPGGPFAIPQGPAWELNSANRRGSNAPRLPDPPDENELRTVRAYGSPFRWYPGERVSDQKDVRQGSINRTVDYLLAPDDLSTARYPTNEELQTVLALQAAVLTTKVALRTKIVDARPNPDPHDKGEIIITLNVNQSSGETRTIKIKADAILPAVGLGEADYGFRFNGSRAEKVLAATRNKKGFPKLSTTLEAFRALSDRSSKKSSPGEVLFIWGSGNSADTLIESIGNIFQGDNPRVRDVTKIYLITEKDLSSRPRYALINDLKPRNGKGNLIEVIKNRVTDVDFATEEEAQKNGRLILYGSDGQIITGSDGKPLLADAGIAATGFKPQIETIFASYLDQGQSFSEEGENSPVDPLTLPTNPDVPVADVLRKQPNIMFIGTASRPRFNLAKLAQLPVEAREALLRNGAENAVAIGFRAPDTQAAVNIWLNSREIRLAPTREKTRTIMPQEGDISINSSDYVANTVDRNNLAIPNNIESENGLLSPLLSYLVGNSIEIRSANNRGFNGELRFNLSFDQNQNRFDLSFLGGSVDNISSGIFNQIKQVCQDNYLQRYALSLLQKRRRNPRLELNLSFKEGKLNPRETFVQEI